MYPARNESHDEFIARYTAEHAAAAARRDAAMPKASPPQAREPALGPTAVRFRASMTMTLEMWHDGLSYDLEALKQIPPDELPQIEALLLRKHPTDWRDIEALAQLDSPAARAAVVAALRSSDPSIRRVAMDYAPEHADPAEREQLLIKSLEHDILFGGLSQAIDEAEEFHPPAVIDALFRGALHRDGQAAVHFAALLFFIHGKSTETFDWNHRPFFLRFADSNRHARVAAFRELCQAVGVDPQKYLH